MDIRILPGRLQAYLDTKGSWNEAKPDENSFKIEVAAAPVAGQPIVFFNPTNDNKLSLAIVENVVVVEGTGVYVFVLQIVEISPAGS